MNLDHALTFCLALLLQGWEWPDASAKAATRYRVDIVDLTEAYDTHCSTPAMGAI